MRITDIKNAIASALGVCQLQSLFAEREAALLAEMNQRAAEANQRAEQAFCPGAKRADTSFGSSVSLYVTRN